MIIKIRRTIHHGLKVVCIEFPYDEKIIRAVRSLPGAIWSKTLKCWYISDNEEALIKLDKLAQISKVNLIDFKVERSLTNRTQVNRQLLITRYLRDRIKLSFNYNIDMVSFIKTIPRFFYIVKEKSWTVPHTEDILKTIKDYCYKEGWTFKYTDTWAEHVLVKRRSDDKYEEIIIPSKFVEKLKLLRYSENTIMNYSSALREFIRYYYGRDLESLEKVEKPVKLTT